MLSIETSSFTENHKTLARERYFQLSELYFSFCVKFGSGVKLLRGLLNSFENPASFEIN